MVAIIRTSVVHTVVISQKLSKIRVATTPGNPGNLLEFENPPGNPGNLLEFKWSSWKFLCNDYCMVNGFTT